MLLSSECNNSGVTTTAFMQCCPHSVNAVVLLQMTVCSHSITAAVLLQMTVGSHSTTAAVLQQMTVGSHSPTAAVLLQMTVGSHSPTAATADDSMFPQCNSSSVTADGSMFPAVVLLQCHNSGTTWHSATTVASLTPQSNNLQCCYYYGIKVEMSPQNNCGGVTCCRV